MKNFLKDIIILSLILGLIFGVISNIPYAGTFSLLAMILVSAPFVFVYLIMAGKFDLTTVKDSIIQGAVCGFSSNISFTVGYCLTNLILFFVFHYTNNSILTSIITNAPFWLIAVCVVFIGVLTATTNAFSGLGTYYVINYIRDNYEKTHRREETWQNLNQK